MMGDAFMQDASSVYRAWLRSKGWVAELDTMGQALREQGRLMIALDLISTMRYIEDLGEKSTSLLGLNSDTVVNVLQTFLVQQDLFEDGVRLYDELAEWRRTKFVAVREGGDVVSDAGRDALASDGEAHL